MNVADKLLEVIDSVANPPKKPTAILLGETIISFTKCGPSKAELETLRDCEAVWTKGMEARMRYSEPAAQADYRRQLVEHSAHVKSGKLAEIRTRGAESLASEYRGKNRAAEIAQQQAEAEAGRIAKTVTERFLAGAEKFLATREKTEQAEAESFGLAWVPTAVTTATRGLITTLRNRLALDSIRGRPSGLFSFLTLD